MIASLKISVWSHSAHHTPVFYPVPYAQWTPLASQLNLHFGVLDWYTRLAPPHILMHKGYTTLIKFRHKQQCRLDFWCPFSLETAKFNLHPSWDFVNLACHLLKFLILVLVAGTLKPCTTLSNIIGR